MAEEDILVDDDDFDIIEGDGGFTGDEITEVDLQDYEEMKKTYRTPPYLTKYEKTKILAERAQQLTNGSETFVDGVFTNTYEVALKELREGKIPFILKRPYGNTFEYWKVKDLL